MSVKVLFVGMTPNPGGLETYMINIFSELQGKGFSFSFINIFNKKIAYSNYIVNNGGKIYNIPFKNGIKKYLTRYTIIKHFFNSHHDFDIVHINALTVNQVFWAKAAKRCGIHHIILQSHNSNVVYKSKIIKFFGNLMSFLNRLYLRNTHYITKLAVSNNSGTWMFGENTKFNVICNGINTNKYLYKISDRIKIRKLLNISTKYKIIITTSRLAKQKNYPKIISVFNSIHNLMHNSKLIIIGDGDEREKIIQQVKQDGLSNNVIFLGKRNKKEIPKFLYASDLMLMPSLFEGYPYSLLEAQAAGVPAIVSSYVIPKETNITGCVDYISLDQSDSYWAKRAIRILNKEFSKDHKIYMNQLVKKSNYNIDNSIKQIKNIYTDLVKK